MFFVQKRYCLSSRSRGILPLCASERVSLSYMRRRQTSSLYRGGSVSILYRVVADSFSIYRRENSGESASLLAREEADPFVVQGGEYLSSQYRSQTSFLSSRQHRECISTICRGDSLLLCTLERVSLFPIQRRQTPSLYRRESVSSR